MKRGYFKAEVRYSLKNLMIRNKENTSEQRTFFFTSNT